MANVASRRDVARRKRVAAAFFVFGGIAGTSHAAHAQRTTKLRYDLAADIGVTAAGGLLWLGSEVLKGELAPEACRWCNPPGIDASARSALKWSDTKTPGTISDVLGFGLAPLAILGTNALVASHDRSIENAPVDALVVLEATVLAMDLNQLTKFVVGRERPFIHALAPDRKGSVAQPSDNNVSFFSGHTTELFSLAVAAGTVAQMRGYRMAPVVWAVGGLLAVSTGYLRIAADKHYLTDVLVGMGVGSAIGFAVPYALHQPIATTGDTAVRVVPFAGRATGLSVEVVW